MDVDLGALQLPPGTHAATLTDRVPGTTMDLGWVVVWRDHEYDRCPRCHQEVPREEPCPVVANGCQLESYNLQHQCGEWLGVDWVDLGDDPAEDAILAAARRLAASLADAIVEARARLEKSLRADLGEALARLAEPLDDGETMDDRADEVATGSETEPGVMKDADGWSAWDYNPDGSGDPVVVWPADVDGVPVCDEGED